MTIPVSHLQEAQKLEADPICHLYEVTLKKSGSTVRFWNHSEVTWQGNLYSYWPVMQDKDVVTSDNENPRPTLTIHNPDGLLTPLCSEGEFDLALVVRKSVLMSHVTSNTPIFVQRVWFVGRVISATRTQVSLELRSVIDHPDFNIPPRQYVPPDFPFLVY